MVRRLGLLRLSAGVAVFPVAAVLAASCGGTDTLDSPDAAPDATGHDGSTLDGAASEDARALDATALDATAGDERRPDADATASDADAAPVDAGSGDTEAAVVDADAGGADASLPDTGLPDVGVDAQLDAEAGTFDSGTGSLMQSLGRGAGFVVFGGATVTNTSSGISTILTGDVGTAGPSVTGLAGGPSQPTGSIEVGNTRATEALLDLRTAHTALMGRTCPPANDLTGLPLGGTTLRPGVYCFPNTTALLAASTILTFDAQNDPNAVWIIQVGSSLTVMDNASAIIVNGTAAHGCRIFWAMGTAAATLNGGAHMVGTFIAATDTSLLGNASIVPGRALALNGGVTLISNTISVAGCP